MYHGSWDTKSNVVLLFVETSGHFYNKTHLPKYGYNCNYIYCHTTCVTHLLGHAQQVFKCQAIPIFGSKSYFVIILHLIKHIYDGFSRKQITITATSYFLFLVYLFIHIALLNT